MMVSRKCRKGFGLIEILITLGILSVGILGVTVLHGVITEQSQENKARAEALSIAQSRIEDMRNYTSGVDSLDDFNALYANTSGYANSASITGVNAAFTRTEQIGTSGDLKTVSVRVAWNDPDNEAQSITLNSELTYVAPRSIGDTALEAAASLVDAPTGRARLGEGVLPDGATTTTNSDGTSLYQDGSTELMLVSDSQIVLTLSQACQLDTQVCIDFVRIKGRVYIDTATQNMLDPGEVYVVASDAAFCSRYYVDGNGVTQTVTPDTTSTLLTASGDYEYFNYTCYLGGGWHGNVGILLSGGLAQTDKVCVGDPLASLPVDQPVIASRRAYRGMLYKHDLTELPDLKEQVAGTNLTRYYSQGIADSALLGDESLGDHGHDFVISSMQASESDGSACGPTGEEILVRTDSNVNGTLGDLFEGNPTDFVCLNEVSAFNNNEDYLDNYDTAVYGNEPGCGYDPSDPPSERHIISGTIKLDTDLTVENTVIAQTISMVTSDGEFNCPTQPDFTDPATNYGHDGTYYVGTYKCDVYDWGNGWNGFIEADYDAAEMECDPYQLPMTGITADSPGHDFLTCNTGSFAVISGTVTTSGNRKLSTAVMSNGGACTIAVDGLSYECISAEYSTATMSFTVTFTPTGGVMCKLTAPHSGIYTYTDQAAGNYTQNLRIAANLNGC